MGEVVSVRIADLSKRVPFPNDKLVLLLTVAAREVFFADERIVPLDHEDSNFKLNNDTLFSKVPLPRQNIHTINPELLDNPEEVAEYVLTNFYDDGKGIRLTVHVFFLMKIPQGLRATAYRMFRWKERCSFPTF